MSLIGTLAVNVIANTAAVEKGLNRAAGKVSEFSKSLDQIGLGGAFRGLESMNSAISTIAGEFAPILAAVEAVTAAIMEGAKAADDLAESADKIGVKASELQGFRAVGGESGAKVEAIDAALMKLSEQLGEVQRKNTEVAASFQKLGLDGYQLAAMGTARAFKEIADKIAAIKDPMERNAVLFDLFGKQGRELGPLFAEGAAGIDKAIARAKQLGLVLDETTIRRAGGVNDAAERSGKAWENAGARAAAGWSGKLLEAFYEVKRVAAIAAGDLATGGAATPEKPKSTARLEAENQLIKERAESLRKAAEEAAMEEDRQKRAAKAMEEMKRKAEEIHRALRTPDEIFKDSTVELKNMLDKGVLGARDFERAMRQAAEVRDKALKVDQKKAQVDLPSKAAGSQEAFATWARQQNFMGGFRGDENGKKIEKNTGAAVKELEGVRNAVERLESKPAITLKVVSL